MSNFPFNTDYNIIESWIEIQINNSYKFFLEARINSLWTKSLECRGKYRRDLSKIVVFFFRWKDSRVFYRHPIQLAVSSRPIYPRYDLNWIFSKAPSRVNFHPFAGLSPPIDWPSSRNCRKIDTPTDKIADYRVGDRRKEEIVDYQFSICIGIFFPIEIRSR